MKSVLVGTKKGDVLFPWEPNRSLVLATDDHCEWCAHPKPRKVIDVSGTQVFLIVGVCKQLAYGPSKFFKRGRDRLSVEMDHVIAARLAEQQPSGSTRKRRVVKAVASPKKIR
ncbi:hypothetical protein [Xanthomonas campestris]|uniref:hypothetical protein n=1 Tax=Xanthomonas campestris TaxID=339 RepID=UPI001CD2438C|nr:hypothetical protein [Xanthomonas campestris]